LPSVWRPAVKPSMMPPATASQIPPVKVVPIKLLRAAMANETVPPLDASTVPPLVKFPLPLIFRVPAETLALTTPLSTTEPPEPATLKVPFCPSMVKPALMVSTAPLLTWILSPVLGPKVKLPVPPSVWLPEKVNSGAVLALPIVSVMLTVRPPVIVNEAEPPLR